MRLDLSGLRPSDTSLSGLDAWFFGWIIVPVLATLFLVFGLRDIGPAWNAAHGKGEHGTLLVQSKSCSYSVYTGYRCTGLYGRFTSDDGTVQVDHAFLDTIPEGVGVGDRVATVYEGNAAVVYLAENSHEWILLTAFMLTGLLALVIWAICLWRRLTGRPLPWSEFEEATNSTAPT